MPVGTNKERPHGPTRETRDGRQPVAGRGLIDLASRGDAAAGRVQVPPPVFDGRVTREEIDGQTVDLRHGMRADSSTLCGWEGRLDIAFQCPACRSWCCACYGNSESELCDDCWVARRDALGLVPDTIGGFESTGEAHESGYSAAIADLLDLRPWWCPRWLWRRFEARLWRMKEECCG